MRSRLWKCLLLAAVGGLVAWLGWTWRSVPSTSSPVVESAASSAANVGHAPSEHYLEALFRYRTNQPAHWRHIMFAH
ncbi:MAG: hypothetical protein WHU94_10890 [Thermogemmata sp.]|jgi:hypothetical protein|uniref:Uncharacterized protein n=1 Tax=Thermogemmata fonticola TaxID=2755323 RepID=A0A7V8VEY1_9BACT|nr:hypothetical protein [Thermogemmata fonticola]MBA2226721.1 hypothetical protein [Thermogemmata fonticola]MCX8139056.1 hypothetical protein [Gemmataceae bacterium]